MMIFVVRNIFLLNVTSGTKEVTMEEVTEITEYIQEEAGYGTDMIWGNCIDEGLGSKLSVTIIATGFDNKTSAKVVIPEPKKVSLDDEMMGSKTPSVFDITTEDPSPGQTIEFDSPHIVQRSDNDPFVSEQKNESSDNDVRKVVERRRVVDRGQSRSPGIARPLDNPKDITDMEDVPAYKLSLIHI